MEFCPHCMQQSSGEVCSHCGGQMNHTAAPGQLPLGTLLRGSRNQTYQIGASLGQGGFGITYAAMDLSKGCRVAIKEYYPSHCATRTQLNQVLPIPGQNEDYLAGKRSFLEEAKMLAAVGVLPSVVTVQDYFEDNGTAYLVMEYLDGYPLHHIVTKKGKFSAQELLPKLFPLLNDLDTLHKAGMIHRDISPDNLMLMPDGSLKLLDFGSARSTQSGKAMTVLLKAGFSPVEQYHGRGQGAWTDVYALAGTIYYCITGVIPPTAVDRLDGGTLTDPNTLGAGLTANQEKALLWGMTVQPKSRPQSMGQFRDALLGQGEEMVRMVTTPAGVGSQPPVEVKKDFTLPKWLPYAISGAAVLVMAIGLIVVLAGKSNKPDVQLNNDFMNENLAVENQQPQSENPPNEGATVGDKSGTSSEGFTYTISAGGAECVITGYTGQETVLTIPAVIDDAPVTAIGEDAFTGQSNITRFSLPDSLKEVRDGAFTGCKNLKGIVVESNLNVSSNAFDNCPNMRYLVFGKSSLTLEGWTPSDQISSFVRGMETGIGKLKGIVLVDMMGVIYGSTENQEVVVMDIPDDVEECTISDKIEFSDGTSYPVKWVYEKALDGMDASPFLFVPGNVLYPYEIYDDASWITDLTEDDRSEYNSVSCSATDAWNKSCIVCDGVNVLKRGTTDPKIRPDPRLLEAAMIRAKERVISDEIWRLDDCKWSTVLDDVGITYTYAAEWSTTLPKSEYYDGVSNAELMSAFADIEELYGPMVAEWGEFYTHLNVAFAYDEANDNYKIVCLVIVQK